MATELLVIVIGVVAIAALVAYGLTPSQSFQPVFCNVVTNNTTLACDNSRDTLTFTSDDTITITGNTTSDTLHIKLDKVILKAFDGDNCYQVLVDDLGILSTSLVSCP